MRFPLRIDRLAMLVVCCAPFSVEAQVVSCADPWTAARRDLEIAKIELRLYHQVEYPRELRRLDSDIRLTEAEIEAYEERLREYAPFDRFSTGRPLLVPEQNLRLVLLEAELRLKDLRAERRALVRFHSDRWRLLELRVFEARARVAELEHAMEPVIEDPAT